MALNDDQQFQLELENARNANLLALEDRRAKLEAIRLAKETLIENARNQPVGDSGVSAEDIIAFANKLTASVNG